MFQRRPLETLARRQLTEAQLFEFSSVVGGRVFVIATPELAREVLSLDVPSGSSVVRLGV